MKSMIRLPPSFATKPSATPFFINNTPSIWKIISASLSIAAAILAM